MGGKRHIPESVKADILKLGIRDANDEMLHLLRFFELLSEHVPRINEIVFKPKDDIDKVIERVEKQLKKINPRIRYIYDSANDTLFKYKSLDYYGRLFHIELDTFMELKEVNFDAYLMFIKGYENSLFEYSVQFIVDDMDEEEIENQYGEDFMPVYKICHQIKKDLKDHKDIDYDRSKIDVCLHDAIFNTFNFAYHDNIFYPFDETVDDTYQDIDNIGQNSMDICFAACDSVDSQFGDYQCTMANESYGNCMSVTTPLLWKAYAPDGTTYNNIQEARNYRDLFYGFYNWQRTIEIYIANEKFKRQRIDEPRTAHRSNKAKKAKS